MIQVWRCDDCREYFPVSVRPNYIERVMVDGKTDTYVGSGYYLALCSSDYSIILAKLSERGRKD